MPHTAISSGNRFYRRRRMTNMVAMSLSVVAAAFGLGWLALILGALLWKGFGGLSVAVFTQMTPPPGSCGRAAECLVGSPMHHGMASAGRRPARHLAGTYLAEYGQHSTRLAPAIRFINDILLSAPSIVVGLFIYEIMVVPMGHFSGLRAASRSRSSSFRSWCAPPRTCCSWCRTRCARRPSRSARRGPGHPRVAYGRRAPGMVTGILLAVARISGETAPLLFTALNNQFWSTDLNAPMASLPVVIFQFALSPYEDGRGSPGPARSSSPWPCWRSASSPACLAPREKSVMTVPE